MSERKVLNKYYPPDFDPAKVPKLRMQRERQYTVRTMAPFNMRCNTCGDYIYQGKKFNAKTENVQDQTYIGLRIYRFYIRCPKCISEISFKTDPENEDYTLEHGATRLFEAAKMLRKATEKEKQDRDEEEANNPMKVLENRTKDSKVEMEIIENLEELRELNTRKVDINYSEILRRKAEASEVMMRKQEEEDEALVAQLFGKQEGGMIKRLEDDTEEDEGASSRPGSFMKSSTFKRPSDVLIGEDDLLSKKSKPQEPSKYKFSSKSALAGLVKVKKPTPKSSVLPAQSSPAESSSRQVVDTYSPPKALPSEVHSEDSEPALKTEAIVTETQPTSLSQAAEVGESSGHQGDDRRADDIPEADDDLISRSIQEGLCKRLNAGNVRGAKPKAKSVGLSLLGGYAVSDDSNDSDESSD